MPVYEYKCEKGHLFDVIQSMSDDPVTECEECGAPVQRVFHAPAVHFKGSGFYNTDYGKQKKGKAAENGGDSGKSSDSGDSSSSSEKKSEKKSSDSKSKTSSD
ncbi:MAG: FmdB family transcriptional regulator [Thermoleophilaceae bacterium]|nr:FmdB family transcriptional regulator [Thermoleophilaceae bacterium]